MTNLDEPSANTVPRWTRASFSNATALDRYGKVEEVAALVAFVAGPEASYITGQT